MSIPTQSQSTASADSWENREKAISSGPDFSKLTPDERKKYLAEERRKYQDEQQRVRESLGYAPFKADQKHEDSTKTREEQEKAEEINRLEMDSQSFHRPERTEEIKKNSEKPKSNEQREKEYLAAFKKLFDAAVENIRAKKAFPFQSVAIDNFGRAVTHMATMSDLRDHSQKNSLKPVEIWQRIEKKQARPDQIGLQVEIDMGEEENNSLGLTNLKTEVSLASLMNGGFIEKLSRFTNLAFFAALQHDKQLKDQLFEHNSDKQPEKKPKKTDNPAIQQNNTLFRLNKVADNGGLRDSEGLFEQGRSDTVAFAFNNGSVWGNFDAHGAPEDPKKLQEALDRINAEK